MEEVDSLLLEIQRAALALYLSDLHAADAVLDSRAKDLILQIPDSSYSLSAWNGAISYITGKTSHCLSVLEAKEALTMTN